MLRSTSSSATLAIHRTPAELVIPSFLPLICPSSFWILAKNQFVYLKLPIKYRMSLGRWSVPLRLLSGKCHLSSFSPVGNIAIFEEKPLTGSPEGQQPVTLFVVTHGLLVFYGFFTIMQDP